MRAVEAASVTLNDLIVIAIPTIPPIISWWIWFADMKCVPTAKTRWVVLLVGNTLVTLSLVLFFYSAHASDPFVGSDAAIGVALLVALGCAVLGRGRGRIALAVSAITEFVYLGLSWRY
jgi:hypothetical protein